MDGEGGEAEGLAGVVVVAVGDVLAAAGGDDDVDPAVVGFVEEAVGLVGDEVADVGEGEVGRDAEVVDEAAGRGDEDVCGGEGRGLALE